MDAPVNLAETEQVVVVTVLRTYALALLDIQEGIVREVSKGTFRNVYLKTSRLYMLLITV